MVQLVLENYKNVDALTQRFIVGRKSKLKKNLCLSSLVSTQPVRAPSGAAVRKVEARDERHKIAYSSHFLPPIASIGN